MTTLDKAVELAKKEQKTRKGRRGYSDELKSVIRAASKTHSKAQIGKATGISFPTLQRIIGPSRGSKTRKRSTPSGRQSKRSALSVTVSLPSGARLVYSDLGALRKDAEVLQDAASQLV